MSEMVNATFEDGLLVCLEIVEASESREEAQRRIIQVLDAFREMHHGGRVQLIKDELGIWGIL